jgi:hypothetical protein
MPGYFTFITSIRNQARQVGKRWLTEGSRHPRPHKGRSRARILQRRAPRHEPDPGSLRLRPFAVTALQAAQGTSLVGLTEVPSPRAMQVSAVIPRGCKALITASRGLRGGIKHSTSGADVLVSTMKHRHFPTVGLAHSAALRRSALAAMAAAASAAVVGCGSNSTDTAKATALFRQIVAHRYDVAAGHCARSAQTRWTCTARINNLAREVDVDVHGNVWRVDGEWSESGSTTVLGG